jgi:hypothetical protein
MSPFICVELQHGSAELRLDVPDGGMVGSHTDQANRAQAISMIHVAFTAYDGFAVGADQPPPPRNARGIGLSVTARLADLLKDLKMHAACPKFVLLYPGL